MITASIVLYQHCFQEIKKVIDCILAGPVSVLYIIDNSSNDSLRNLEDRSNRIRYIHSINRGYGAGHNIAIREVINRGGEYHIIINPDIYFKKGTLEKIVQYMDYYEGIGLVMPKVLYPSGKIQYLCKLLPTPLDLLGRRFFPYKKYVEYRNERYELRFTGYDNEMEVPSLSGCFMFIRVSIFEKVGCFDERFFMYAEDIDLCRRIGEVAKTVYLPKVCIYHAYAKGSYKNRKLLKYHICSIIKYFNKWGWFFDIKRRRANQKTLENINRQTFI